jgi:hypothetical protein
MEETKKKRICDGGCGCEFEPGKLKKLIKNGKKVFFCKMCYNLNRQNHRKETIKFAGIEKDLEQLDNKVIKINREIKNTYNPIKEKKEDKPAIKSIKLKDKRQRSFSSISQQEKQMIFKKCINSGMSYSEADERGRELVEYLKEKKTEIRNKHKTDKAAEINCLEELNKACDCV